VTTSVALGTLVTLINIAPLLRSNGDVVKPLHT
jgi:hypothetical protein